MEEREEILKHIDRIFKGFINKDFEELEKTHLPGWTGFFATSRKIIKNRDEYLKVLREKLEKIDYISYKILDINFFFNKDCAVVPYIALLKGKNSSGEKVELKLRIVDFFVKEGRGWNLAGSSVSLHPHEIDRKFQDTLKLILNE